jgi:hypothetical protein
MQLTCPHCGFSREIAAEKIPENATMATCPKCRMKFNFREPSADPIDLLFENDPHGEESASSTLQPDAMHDHDTPPESSPGADPGMDVPWEALGKYGLVPGFFQTILRVMRSPVRLFRSMPLGQGIGKPLVFYLLLAEVEILFQYLWNMIGVTGVMQPEDGLFGLGTLGIDSAMVLVFYPFFLTLGLFLGTAVIHVSLKLVRGATAGYEGTFKAVTYGSAPMILSILPLGGQIVGAIWALVTTLIAYKHVHRTTYPKVVVAILLPAALVLTMAMLIVSFTHLGTM